MKNKMKQPIEILVIIILYGILLFSFIQLIYSKYMIFKAINRNQIQLKNDLFNSIPIIIFPLWFIFLHSKNTNETINNSNHKLKVFYLALFFNIIISLILELVLYKI